MPTSRCVSRHLCIVAAAVALASAAPAPADNPVSGEQPDSPTLHGKLELSLAEAISMGLENNLTVDVERYGPEIAEEDNFSAWGAYDPTLDANLGYSSDEQPNSFALNDVTRSIERTTDGEVGLNALVPYLNARLGLDFRGSRTKTNSTIQAVRPEYNSSVGLTASVPLLRDLVWNEAYFNVRTTRVLEDVALDEFRRSVMDVVRDIETAYWDLIATEEQLRVAEKSLETAKALLDQTETQYEVGVVSRVEVVEARAGVAEREVNLIRADNTYRAAQDTLIDQVLGRGLTAGSRMEIEPTDRPEDYVEYEIDVQKAVAKAFANRPELAAAMREVKQREIATKYRRNQWLPRFDVEGAYRATGRKGDRRALEAFGGGFVDTGELRPDLIGKFDDSVDAIDSADGGDIFSIRGVVSIPIGNVAARGQLNKARFELRRAESELVRLRQRIILDVRDQARNLKSAQEGIEAARRRQEAAAEQLRAERIRLEHGESTPFDVLDREEDLVDAESQLIGAFQLYRTSITNLDRAQGTILETRRVEIDSVRKLR